MAHGRTIGLIPHYFFTLTFTFWRIRLVASLLIFILFSLLIAYLILAFISHSHSHQIDNTATTSSIY